MKTRSRKPSIRRKQRVTQTATPPVSAIASWFGSNRTGAPDVGIELRGCTHASVTFGGGMCELGELVARTINVNDIHRHVVNLARVIRDRRLQIELLRRLKNTAFHPDELRKAQERCKLIELAEGDGDALFASGFKHPVHEGPDVHWAFDYFLVSWMSRHGSAGTKGEFNAPISTRWNSNGGDSNAHFRGAYRALAWWRQKVLQRCNFTTLDCFDFLDQLDDKRDAHGRVVNGCYNDPPFPGPGDGYKHRFTWEQHRKLAERLGRFRHVRVVNRFYDHPLVRQLYPEGRGALDPEKPEPGTWVWRCGRGRKQTNDDAPEVLIINGPSYAREAMK